MKLSRAEQAVSRPGSRGVATPALPFRRAHPRDTNSTSRAGASRERRTFRGPSSAERWHRAGRRYLGGDVGEEGGRRGGEEGREGEEDKCEG